jgi:transposase InsO family protein
MGGLEQIGSDTHAPWTGGPPNPTWTGLNNPKPTSVEPTQYRPTGIGSAAKSQKYRISGLDTKFAVDDDLMTFQKDILDHMIQHGMDTITYLGDPQEPGKMVSVVTDHSKFNFDSIELLELAQKNNYDKYDKSNVRDAKKFLLSSVNPEMKKQIHENCTDEDSFIVYWMNLMLLVRPMSSRQFESIVRRIEGRNIKDYPGENVISMASDYLSDFTELHQAGMYEHKLTYTMLSQMMEGGGSNNEDYRSSLRTVKDKINSTLLEIRHKNYKEKNLIMTKAKLDVPAILKRVKQKYREVKEDNKWPAAAHAKDSKGMKPNYGATANSAIIDNAVYQLTQMLGANRDKSSDACNNCGEKGHWARECPKKSNRAGNSNRYPPRGGAPPRGGGQRPASGQYNGRRDSRATPRTGSRPSGPRPPGTGRFSTLPAPKPGESETRMHGDRKIYYCQKCKRWTSNHATATHKSKEELHGDDARAGMARVDFDLHPAAYKITVSPNSYSEDDSDVPDEPHSVQPHTPGYTTPFLGLMLVTMFVGSLFGTWFKTSGWDTDCIETLGPLLNSFSSTFVALLSQHWLSVVLAIVSGSIGGITMLLLGRLPTAPEPRVRYRKGPNYRKRWRRQQKFQAPRSRLPRATLADTLLSAMERSSTFATRPEYHHVPRPLRRRSPDQERLIHLRREIAAVDRRIQELVRNKVQLEAELAGLIQQQWRVIRNTNPVRVPSSEGAEPTVPTRRNRRHRHNKRNVKKTWATPDVTEFYHSVPLHAQVKCATAPCICATAPCINISSIDSSSTASAAQFPVLFDSGANCCLSHRKDDFVGPYAPSTDGQMIDGIGKSIKIEGRGTVAWTFMGINGMYRTLKLPCYYVPTSHSRIASIKCIMDCYPGEYIRITPTEMTLSGNQRENLAGIKISFCDKTKLPMAPLQFPSKASVNSVAEPKKPKKDLYPMGKFKGSASLTEGVNFNLSDPEKELLKWHYRLGHVGMRRVQWLFRQNILSTTERSRRLQQAASKLTSGPLCTACQYAKQRRKTAPGSIKRTDKLNMGALKIEKMFPGQMVSVDHFMSSTKGRLLHTYGKEADEEKFRGGCIFVDHSSGYIHVELQSHLSSHETLGAKKEFETMSAGYGVVIQEYLSDNGTAFRNADYIAHLEQFHQTMKHAAVGAHHSNGIAERSIGHVLSISRAMLHHCALHWPDVSDVELWPLAVLHAVHVLNRLPREDTGMSPLELYSRKTWARAKLQDLHVWGCPAYVLDSSLADAKKLPRWKPRSDRSIYVGHSPLHSSAIPLVLNLNTGHISPQYHVVFDDWFQTVSATEQDQPNFEHDDWYKTFGLTEWQYVPDDDVAIPPAMGQSELATLHRRDSLLIVREQADVQQPIRREHDPATVPLPAQAPVPVTAPPLLVSDEPAAAPIPAPLPPQPLPQFSLPIDAPPVAVPPPASPQRENIRSTTDVPTPSRPRTRSQAEPTLRRSSRVPKPKIFTLTKPDINYWSSFLPAMSEAAPFAGKAKVNKDPDLFTWDQAMDSEYRDEFVDAAQVEIEALVSQGTWREDLRSNATTRVVPSQWVFRIKRSPGDGSIKKFKARCVLRGDLQEYEGDTYSPVASWSTVRLAIVMCMRLNWTILSIDFSNAFVQSPLPKEDPVWMHVPRGYSCSQGKEYVLKLEKSLYGLAVAPLLFFQYTSKAFKKLGMEQSEHDQCLWYRKDLILVQYVDDCGIGAPTEAGIDEFVSQLRQLGLTLTKEGSFSEFLGIKFDLMPDNTFKMTQQALINKILQAADMSDCNPNTLPAAQSALGADKDGEEFNETWNYRAIVGMLLYLSTNTRCDIAFAVSQVARFGSNPKKSHATAVKTILRYLKKTVDKGMILNPTKKFIMDLYVDADFCGLFQREDDRDPNSARSRAGWVILLCGCPLIWKSTLLQQITQSTTEAEYSALTGALRVFLPLKLMVEEMIVKTQSNQLEGAMVHATVFEDNQSAFYLATNQRITNRTRYFLAKWHWFWASYNEKMFDIVKCPTELMLADYFTKSLPKDSFERNRIGVQGW